MSRFRVVYSKPPKFYVDGNEVAEKVFNALCPKKPVAGLLKEVPQTLMQTSKSWPRVSDAFGVGAKQKAKAEAMMAKLGVPTEYVPDRPDGQGGYSAVIRDNQHQRDLLKALKMHNNEAGYGQVTG